MKVLVTGAAGFIGMHVTQKLLARGDTVVGIENVLEGCRHKAVQHLIYART